MRIGSGWLAESDLFISEVRMPVVSGPGKRYIPLLLRQK